MGSEAGQPLEAILWRKELERQAGDGIFSWGIGNSLGSSVEFARQLTSGSGVEILFSPMKSKPKAIDVAPTQLVLWLSYRLPDGRLADLPEHMLITSRGGASGSEKRTHYALFCERCEAIDSSENSGVVDAARAKNLVSSNPLGASQVTAMVRYGAQESPHPRKPYPVLFRARMYQEGFVRLATPVVLMGSLLSDYRLLCAVQDAKSWLYGAVKLRRDVRAAMRVAVHSQGDLLIL